MASNDLYLRSDTDKGETSPDKDLRLRADSDKVAGDQTLSSVGAIASLEAFGTLKSNFRIFPSDTPSQEVFGLLQ